jgi:hypothetical protein
MLPNVTRGIAERFHQERGLVRQVVDGPALPRPSQVQPFGPLMWLEMTYAHGRRSETWDFSPRPWLTYSLPTRAEPRPRMWVVGGSFQIDQRGFRNLRGPVGLQRIPVAEAQRQAPAQARRYVDTHYGAEATQAVEGELERPKILVVVGWLDAIAYETDRNDGDGLSNWRHVFSRKESPMICTSTHGRGLYFVGGSYSVRQGWLV